MSEESIKTPLRDVRVNTLSCFFCVDTNVSTYDFHDRIGVPLCKGHQHFNDDYRFLEDAKNAFDEPYSRRSRECKHCHEQYSISDAGALEDTCASCWKKIFDANLPQYSKKVFTSGAQRSADSDHKRFDLVCPTALGLLAETMAEGAKKYDEFNWCKGLPIGDTLSHAVGHITAFANGDRSENHLGHALANIMFVSHFVNKCDCHKAAAELKRLDDEYVQKQGE